MENQENKSDMALIKGIATVSTTPFRIAFKVALGIAAAQMFIVACVLGIVVAFALLVAISK